MDTQFDWDDLVGALTNELQEKGRLIRLLNQQTETLYRHDRAENERLEEQIRSQLRLITRCTEGQDQVVEHTPSAFLLHKDVPSIEGSPNFLHPLLKALSSEVNRLNDRIEVRLEQNQGLKERFLFESPSQ
jgi:hypothetical protein